jgi:hypothetical protein
MDLQPLVQEVEKASRSREVLLLTPVWQLTVSDRCGGIERCEIPIHPELPYER